MAKRPQRRAGGRKPTVSSTPSTFGSYWQSGSKQVNEAISAFLSMFDTSDLIAALKRQARSVGLAGTATPREDTRGGRRAVRKPAATPSRRPRPAVRRNRRS
jgi:hypothetical protein